MRAGGVLLVAAALGGAAEAAAQAGPQGHGIQLMVPVQETLARLQDQWLLWNSAFLQGDREQAEAAIQDLLATVDELGMSKLPDLSLGILARAVESARDGDVERALWALEMAERLDPGRPETRFARSRVTRLDGSYFGALGAHLGGYLRVFGQSHYRRLALHNVLLWLMAVLVFSGGLYVALMLATKGSLIYREIASLLARTLPAVAAHALTLGILVWPFLVPRGWVWLVLYWAALLWSYSSRSERWVLGGICAIYAFTPIVVHQQQRAVGVAMSAPMRAVENLAAGRLHGSLFQDLEILESALPESRAVKHLIADLHTRLGQGELARSLYAAVLDEEPDNSSALLNLGIYYYHRLDHIKAIEQFKAASAADPDLLAAYYNLSQTYKALLEFRDSDEYLDRARQVNASRVNEWIASSETAVVSNGGFERASEIRRQLVLAWHGSSDRSALDQALSQARSAPVAFGALVLAFILQLLRQRRAPMTFPSHDETVVDRLARAAVPGLESAEEGSGLKALTAIVVPVGALFLPLGGAFGYRLSWGYDPGNTLSWVLCVAIIGFLVAVRFYLGRK